MIRRIKRITRSLSFRLVAVFFLTSMAYGIGSYYAVKLVRETDYIREIVGAHIALHADLIRRAIGTPPDPARARAIVERVPVDIRLYGPGVDWTSDPAFPALDSLPLGPISVLGLDQKSQKNLESWAQSLERVRSAYFKGHYFIELKEGPYVVVFASPRVSETAPPDLTGVAIIIVTMLGLTMCYFAVRWLIRPIKWIQKGTERIGQGDLDYRIQTNRRDDLGELASQINHMADDVRDMLEAKQQLLLAISHELRSPLTRAKVALEFLEDGQVKHDLLGDIRDMERLIADLLESERMNAGHTTLHRSPVELCGMLRSLIQEDFSDRTDRIVLRLSSTPLLREVDGVRIRLVAKNLIENALRYTPPGGPPVEVELDATPGMVVLRVRDHGPGIPKEHIHRVTEPFYRADPARSRSTGGLGLGLYLAKRIAEAHRGTLTIESEQGQGTLVTVTFPDVVVREAA